MSSTPSWKTPTPEQVSQAVAQLSHVERQRYFFDRLHNPLWLKPLDEKGFFETPGAPVRDEAQGTTAFPPWPASRYLARMAKLPEAQATVLEIALKIPDTANISVHEDLADVALALPVEQALALLSRVRRWIEAPYHRLLLEKLGDLVASLARGGKTREALRLAKLLLVVRPGVRAASDVGGRVWRLPPEPSGRIDIFTYEQVLERCVPALVDIAGQEAVKMLADLLETAVRLSLPEDTQQPQDYSQIWRPAIEDHEQNRGHSVRHALVNTVRDAAERLSVREPMMIPAVVRSLEARPWHIFHRLALHLLAVVAVVPLDLVEERLTDHAGFVTLSRRHEYVRLAVSRFPEISATSRQRVLDWIDVGPDASAMAARYREDHQKEASPEQVERFVKTWRLERLAPLRGVLPLEWRQRYDALVAELGEPEHPDFPFHMSSGWVGPGTPRSADELRAMPTPAIVAFLREWIPPGGLRGASREGLGREVASLAKAEPGRFADDAALFVDLDPTYVRSVLDGLRDAIGQAGSFAWERVLDLCAWVVGQPREIVGRQVDRFEEDPDWGWTRKAIADLLAAGFEDGAAGMPFALRQRAWAILVRLTEDPDPAVDRESPDGGSGLDSATLSINSTRGAAMHCVVHYALWVRRHLEHQSSDSSTGGFAIMPEVREVLESHLDPARDQSLAIRAVYGQWFPWLVLLDRGWATARAPAVFPEASELMPVWDAAWSTYIVFSAPYDNVFETLKHQYALAVERIGSARARRSHLADPEVKLADHLMLFYGRGKLVLDEPGGLLERFYARASDQLRGHAVESIGRRLADTQGQVPAETVERLRLLWERRVETARRSAAGEKVVEELANFGWWFTSGKLDEDWALIRLEEALLLAGRAEPDYLIAEKLAEIAPGRPLEAVRCLAALVEADRDGWKIHAWLGQVQTILTTVLAPTSGAAREEAISLIHRLGERGHSQFRGLLNREE